MNFTGWLPRRKLRDDQEYIVYALIDPRDNATRYIGMAIDPGRRVENHHRCGGPAKVAWVKALTAEGLKPRVVHLERIVGRKDGLAAERFQIRKALAAGAPLLNVTHGTAERKPDIRRTKWG